MKITNEIHSTHTSNLNIRANFLYDLYRSESDELPECLDYLDIGCGYGVNSGIFGQGFENIYCSDFNIANSVKCKEYMSRHEKVFFLASDAQSLPFKDKCFDLITAISLIEHVFDQKQMVREVLRVLKRNGVLAMQFPNKHFFMELHSGIPFYCMVPGFAKPWVSRKWNYSGLSGINIPMPGEIKKIIGKIDPEVDVKIIKVIYPVELMPRRFRIVYSLFKKIGIFGIVPFGWMMICKK
jgi:ubiquinone/menaquinone biosynthesis C-methylase UbiE